MEDMSVIIRSVRGGRKNGHRALLTALATITLGVAVIGCGSSSGPSSSASSSASKPASATSVTIGFSPFNQSSPALVGLAKSLTAYAATKGAKTRVVDPNNNSTTQVQELLSMIELGEVKAVWAMAINPERWRP